MMAPPLKPGELDNTVLPSLLATADEMMGRSTGGKRSDFLFSVLIECVPDPRTGGTERRRYRIENDYDKEVCNGDIGTIDDVDADAGELEMNAVDQV